MFAITKKRSSSILNLHQQNINHLTENQNKQFSPIKNQSVKLQQKLTSNQSKQLPFITERSSPILPKLKNLAPSQLTQMKKVQKNQTKQLAVVIQRYHLKRAQHMKLKSMQLETSTNGQSSSDQLLLDILGVLKQFSKTQNNFQQLFELIYRDIKKYIFLTGQFEFAQRYDIKQGQTYKKICQVIDSKVNRQLRQNYNTILRLQKQNKQLAIELSTLKTQFSQKQVNYLAEIERFKKITNADYVLYLEQKIQEMKDRIFDLEQSDRCLVQQKGSLQKLLDQKQQKLKEAIKEIGTLKATIYDLRIGKQKSQKMFCKLRDRFDQLHFKLSGIKDTIDTVQTQNQNLKSQRILLTRRAAVSFDQLTPRPKYKTIFNFNQDEANRKLKSTADLSQVLANRLGTQISKKDLRIKLFDPFIKTMHPKLQQVDKIREQTVSDIAQSKTDIKQVQRAFLQEP